MRALKKLPVSLLQLPLSVRLGSVICLFPLCMFIYALVYPYTHSAISLVIPILIAAWFFRYRGMLLCLVTTLFTALAVRTFFFHISIWLPSSHYYELTATIAALTIGLIIAYLRSTVDIVEVARQKAQRAEKELQVAYQQQQDNMQQKDRFLMHINHELRSPLTTIYSSLQLLQSHYDGESPLPDEFQTQCVQRSMQSCEDLITLINHVMKTTTLNGETIPPHLETVSVYQVIQNILDEGDLDIMHTYSLRLKIPKRLQVEADREFLGQIFRHLLSNVCKYCPPQTPVTISVTYDVPPDFAMKSKMVCIRVQDAGPGIPPEEATQIFLPFGRLQRDIAMQTPGSGLGLAISKQLVETMDGSIWVESTGQPGIGSCFCVALPADE